MNKLDVVIKKFIEISKKYKKLKGENCIEYRYYKAIIEALIYENNNKSLFKKIKKPIYHYFMYCLPQFGTDYFEFLYNPYNPVRYVVETYKDNLDIKE